MSSYFNQHHLTEKLALRRMIHSISNSMLFMFCMALSRMTDKVRLVNYELAVRLKSVHNDPEVERSMIRRTYMYLAALLFSMFIAMLMISVDACINVIKKGETFTANVAAYPNIDDTSALANLVRAICFIFWWILFTRMIALYILVIPLVTCLSHQYKNLYSYFLTLSDIFEREDLNQLQKEEEYEAAFKVGIKIHSDTLRCTQLTLDLCRGLCSGQIIFNLLLIIVLLAQMMNLERTLLNLGSSAMTMSTVLIGTGIYMWNAGDVTVEAANLATSMFYSGWHNCQGRSSARIRNLVGVAMAHAQRPVILKGYGYIDLSYQSYIKIVKASYSVFSVLY